MRAVAWHGKRDVRVSEVPDPPAAAPATIRSYPDGPLLVRGSFVLQDVERGAIPVTRSVIALCRCGRSKAAPICDGSHRARRSTLRKGDALSVKPSP